MDDSAMSPLSSGSNVPPEGDPGRDGVRRPKRPALDVIVVSAEAITPSMRRIAFQGNALAGLDVTLPAQWLKVLLPAVDGERQVSRAYTIRRFDLASRLLEIDFVLHGDAGPASAWASRAQPGDRLGVTGTRGGHVFADGVAWRLLAGDETALPAIASILEAAPAGAPIYVVVETPTVADEQDLVAPSGTALRWLPRDGGSDPAGSRLVETVRAWRSPPGPGQVFLAGEARAVKALRPLFDQVPSVTLDAKGYWAAGQADHRG